MNLSDELSKLSKNFKMENGCLLVGIQTFSPYSAFDGKKFVGPCIEVFDVIMKKLGLCYKYVWATPRFFGRLYPNGTWTGLVGLGQREEVELIVCPIGTSYDRIQVIDYSTYAVITDYSIIYPRPVLKPNISGFVMPFSYQTWILVLLTIFFLTLLSFLMNKLFYVPLSDVLNFDEKSPKSVPNETWFCALVTQPSREVPKEYGIRFLVSIWHLVAVILVLIFKCNLKAQLIVRKVEIPFNTLEELVNQKEYSWAFMSGSIIESLFLPAFKEDPNSLMGRAWSGVKEQYKDPNEIAHFVADKNLVCISLSGKVEALFSDDFSETGKCRFATAQHRFIQTALHFAGRKKTKFLKFIDRYLGTMRDMGIVRYLLDKPYTNGTYCNVPPGSENKISLKPLTVTEFLGPFCILATGYGLATISFFVEFFKKKPEMQSTTKKDYY